MIRRGEKPDIFTYNTLMDRYCLQGQVEKAVEVFKAMVRSGHEPDVISYSILVNGYCKTSQMDNAMQLLRDMDHKGLTPDIVTYTTLIDGLCKIGKILDAKEVFENMKRNDQSPDVVTYSALINGLYIDGCFSEAMQLYHMMESNGHKAKPCNLQHYTLLFVQKLNEARELFCSLTSKVLQSDTKLYNTMISAFYKEGMLKEAQEIIKEGSKMKQKKKSLTYRLLLNKTQYMTILKCDSFRYTGFYDFCG